MKINALVLSLLLSPLVASAQGEIGMPLRDFSGGINDNTATIALKPNESPDALNVVVDEPWGNLKTRRGRLTCGNTPSGNQVTNAHEYVRSNGNHDLILTDNITVWATQDCVIFSTITTGLNSIAAPYFDTFRDKLWIVNKSTWVITWDGATATLLDGVGTRPNPPVSQYITHWKERVWVARTASEPSAIYFTDLTDDSGTNIDPSLSSRAWPTANAFYIAQEDGSPIYAIKVYRDNLFVFKETGIWRILFESVYNTQIVKSMSNVGCKFQDSIVELDNFLYFVGNDGIYKFDGNAVVRISDNIVATFKRLKQPSRLDKFHLWDTNNDYESGVLDINVSTVPTSGSVSLMYEDFADLNFNANPVWGYATVGYSVPSATNGYIANYDITQSAYVSIESSKAYGTWEWDSNRLSSDWADIKIISSSSGSLNANSYFLRYGYGGANYSLLNGNGPPTVCTIPMLSTYYGGTTRHTKVVRDSSGNFTVTYGTHTCSGTDNTIQNSSYFAFEIGNNGHSTFDNFLFVYKSTGVYTSEISTHTNLSLWKTFDVDNTLNGQTINYSIRTATSVATIGAVSYAAIIPGATISTITANKYAQWKATFTTTDNGVTPLLNSVTLNWVEGDASATRLMAVNYNNRYMLTGSTTPANDYNDIVLVKTKAPLDNWTIYDWQISAFTRWNNNLYGGVSNGDDISRFDYGSNDNGAAINAYWTWGDQHWDRMSYKKNLKEIYGYYIPTVSSANTFVSYSIDGGTTWTDKTINMTGTTAFGTKKLNINGGIGNAIRFKISNRTLDESFNILGLDLWALPYLNRE